MAIIYKIPGYKIAGHKIASPVPMATRTEVAAYINSISDSSISLSVSGDSATFTFPAATPGVARAIAEGLGDGNLVTIGVVRNSAKSNNTILGYAYHDYHQDRSRKQDRGWNYRNWIGNYWPSAYTFQRPVGDHSVSYYHKLTIMSRPFTDPNYYNGRQNKLTAEELTTGRAVRDISKVNYTRNHTMINEFYIGLIYWDTNQTPCKFKMKYYSHNY